jgi:hypothetical protein
VQCVQSKGKRKLQCTDAKYVTWAFDKKIALSCNTQNSSTKVMKIIILHLHTFKDFSINILETSDHKFVNNIFFF